MHDDGPLTAPVDRQTVRQPFALRIDEVNYIHSYRK